MIILKKLDVKIHVTNEYVEWMNDKTIHNFTEQKYLTTKRKDVSKYVTSKNNSKDEFLFGIFAKKNNKHIGNIKLGPVNKFHKRAEISYFIGSKEYLKKSYGYFAIQEIIKFAKKKGIKKLKAGCYSNNLPSVKVLMKNGFKLEGVLKSEIIYKKKRIDGLIFGKLI
jgi:[ribosomal protein S5]-alanine N-acetyltransferase|tara:strand:+ start:633 stop:1133 length:501 start_codon:yes stop_codon:yes gene_type:complete